ncbi:hydroxylysine kinase-like isoform X8 [Branchiostoma floridae x Branchiostoma japonicum]
MDQTDSTGEIVEKPSLTEEQATRLAERLYGFKVETLRPLDSYDDLNFHVIVDGDNSSPHGYTLKVTNGTDSQHEDVFEAQNQMMTFLADKGLPVPQAVPNLLGDVMSLENLRRSDNGGCSENLVRLLTYLPGTVYHNVPMTLALAYEAGVFLAKVQEALKDFSHPALHRPNYTWSLAGVASLEKYTHCLHDDRAKEIITKIVQTFAKKVLPRMDELPQVRDPIVFGGHFLAGFESVRPLTPAEWDVLYYCVVARASQSYVLGRYTASIHPQNTEYLMVTAGSVWKFIDMWWQTPKEEIYKQWRDIQKSVGTQSD